MTKRHWIMSSLLVFAMGFVVHAQDANLKWEFVKDKGFIQEMKTVTKQTMKVQGMDITQNQDQTFRFSWTPKDQDKDKNWTVVQKIEAVKMNIEIGGNTINYDSEKDAGATGNPLGDFFKALIGSEFTLKISPDMKILEVKGRDEFINKLVKANPQMEPLLKQILGDDALKQMADPAFQAVPSTPVKKGATWDRKTKLNMGPIGAYDTTYKYTYDGKEGKLDKIKVDVTLDYSPPVAGQTAALPFKIKAAKLTSKNAGGTIMFDNEKHRLDTSDMKLTLEGTLTIDINGNPTDVTLNQEQTTTVKTSDQAATPATTAPAAKK